MPLSHITIRQARSTDDVFAIAAYIYLTDPYIYPTLFPSPDDPEWIDIIRQCFISPQNIFSSQHISVALAGEKIIGLCCMIPCGKPLRFHADIKSDASLAKRLSVAVNGYFVPLLEESEALDGYCITNICIDEAFRGKGIGRLLLRHCIGLHENKPIHLDVIADNTPALRLYQSLGFEIVNRYEGFSGANTTVPCYRMKRVVPQATAFTV